jgi:excinuclease UvrABC helicase subunit UvrB
VGVGVIVGIRVGVEVSVGVNVNVRVGVDVGEGVAVGVAGADSSGSKALRKTKSIKRAITAIRITSQICT